MTHPAPRLTLTDLPMGGCSTATAHQEHLDAGSPICENGTGAPRLSPPGSGLPGLAADLRAAEALAATTTDGLLRAFAALTHAMHEEHARDDRTGGRHAQHHADRTADLRRQRDLIRAEVLRRTGDL